MEGGELKTEASWQSFVTARMAMMGLVLDKLQRENKCLQEEIQGMQNKNTEDRGIFLGRLEK